MESTQRETIAEERGFVYDRLTAADDNAVAAIRDVLFACPCGEGPWLSLRTGTIYTGRGGNEREQWELQRDAPWVRLQPTEVVLVFQAELIRARDAARESERRLREGIAALIEGDDL